MRLAEKDTSAGKMMRARSLVLVGVILLVQPVFVGALEYKIGFVNVEKIFREAQPAQKAQKKLEKEFQPRVNELQKLEKQIKDLQVILDREGGALSDSERRTKERELANLNRDFQRAQREFREDKNLRMTEETAAVQERANKIIQQIAETEKYDLIVQEVIFASSRIDITDKVIKALAAEK